MKKKMFISVAIVVTVSVLLITGTMALFTSETVIEGNTLAAGKLELNAQESTAVIFEVGNMFPGAGYQVGQAEDDDNGEMMVTEITNSGTLPYYLKAVISESAASPAKGSTGYLPEKVNLFVTLTGPNGEVTYREANLSNTQGQDLVWLVTTGGMPLVIEPDETVNFRLFGQFDLSASNDYQESAWEGAITFTAVQSDGQGSTTESVTWNVEQDTSGNQAEDVSEEPKPVNDSADNTSFSDNTIMDIFKKAMKGSAIKYEDFMSKDPIHNVGTPPYAEYNVNSWNGYLEKLLEAGDVESNLRLTNTSPHYGKNTIGYVNPFSENAHKQAVVNLLNRGIFNYLRNNNPYKTMIPLAMIITRDNYFDHSRADDSFIRSNLDILTGTMVLYKPDNRPNDQVQVYFIKEDGSKSELVPIAEILPWNP